MRSFRSKPVGWRNESYRHYLAAKGIVTRYRASISLSDKEILKATKLRILRSDLVRLEKKKDELWERYKQTGDADLDLYDEINDIAAEISMVEDEIDTIEHPMTFRKGRRFMARKWFLIARTGKVVGNPNGYASPEEALKDPAANSKYVFLKEGKRTDP